MRIDNTHGTFYYTKYDKIQRLINFCNDRFIDSEDARKSLEETMSICKKIFRKIKKEESDEKK